MTSNQTSTFGSKRQISSLKGVSSNIDLGEFGPHITVRSFTENALSCVSKCHTFNIKNKMVVYIFPFF